MSMFGIALCAIHHVRIQPIRCAYVPAYLLYVQPCWTVLTCAGSAHVTHDCVSGHVLCMDLCCQRHPNTKLNHTPCPVYCVVLSLPVHDDVLCVCVCVHDRPVH